MKPLLTLLLCLSCSQAWAEVQHSVGRVRVPDAGNVHSLGSCAYIDSQGQYGWVVTNYHVVRDWDKQRQIVVYFSNGASSGALLEATDSVWDLALLKINAMPGIEPLPLRDTAPQIGEVLTIHGYGSEGRLLSQNGQVAAYRAPEEMMDAHEWLELRITAREGDSGGAITDQEGNLAGIIWGSEASRNETMGVYCGRVNVFLTQCQNGQCFRPGPIYMRPRQQQGRNVAEQPYSGPPRQPATQQPPRTQPNPADAAKQSADELSKSIDELREMVKAMKPCECKPEAKPPAISPPITYDPPKQPIAGKDGAPGPAGPPGNDGKDAVIDYEKLADAMVKQLPPVRVVLEGGNGQANRRIEVPLGGDIRLPAIAVERWGLDSNGANVKLDEEKYRLDTPLKLRYGVPSEVRNGN